MTSNKLSGFIKSHTSGWLLSKALLFGGAWISIVWSIYFAVVTISIPYQIEFREGAAQVMTGFLLNRNNPFVLENQPLAMNNYGMGYNLIVMPFARLFGNTLLVHRSVTFLFILLSAAAGFSLIYKIKGELASASAYAAFIMIGLLGQGGVGAFPSAMGTFLFMMAIWVPFLRAFNPASLTFSAFLSIAAFYAKAYFVLGIGVVLSYIFLFVSKKTALLYGIFFLSVFAASLIAARLVFPLYFINTIIGNISNAEKSTAHLFSQLTQLLIYFSPVLLALPLLVLKKDGPTSKPEYVFDLRHGEQPLLGLRLDYFAFASVCVLLAFILILGPHIGNYLNYAYQLIVPVFFCWFFLKFDLLKKTAFLITVAVVFNLFFWAGNVLPARMLEQKNSKEWASLYAYVQSSANILNSPVITSEVMELGLNPLDSGQTSYFYAVKPYPDSAVLGPSYEAFQADGFRYIRFIDNAIARQRFDLIVTTKEKSTFYHAKLIEKFYAPVAEIKVDMPQTGEQWTVLLWKPIPQ